MDGFESSVAPFRFPVVLLREIGVKQEGEVGQRRCWFRVPVESEETSCFTGSGGGDRGRFEDGDGVVGGGERGVAREVVAG